MIWTQGLLSFCLWIGYGYYRSKSSDTLRVRLSRVSRVKRGLGGAAYLVGAMVFLFAALFGVQTNGGFGPNGMTGWAWLCMTLVGFVFVHGQVEGTAMLVSLVQESVTSTAAHSSSTSEQDKIEL